MSKRIVIWQPPSYFATIEDFFAFEIKFQALANQTRVFIKQNFPDLREKLSYGVPFYALNKNIIYLCYRKDINHRDKKLDHAEFKLFLGFWQGNKMFDSNHLFQETNHALVRYILLDENVDFELIKDYILQAIDLGI